MATRSPLEDLVLFAFRQAYESGQLDVAEHLLRALENLSGKEIGPELGEAYRVITDHPPTEE